MCSRHPGGLTLSLLVLALLLCSCLSWSQQVLVPPPPSQPSIQASQLSPSQITISVAMLQIWVSKLDQADSLLKDSNSKTADLQQALAQVKLIVQNLKNDLAQAQDTQGQSAAIIQQLKDSLSKSQTISDALSAKVATQAQLIDTSKKEGDKAILNLEIQRNGWRIAGIVGVAVGVAGLIWGLAK